MRESGEDLGGAYADRQAAGAAVYNAVNPGSVVSGDVVINLDGTEIARIKGAATTSKVETVTLNKSDLTKAVVRLA